MIPKHKIKEAMSIAGLATYQFDVIIARSTFRDDNVRRAKLLKALKDMGYSLKEIGRTCGRHHTTVLNAIRACGGSKNEKTN